MEAATSSNACIVCGAPSRKAFAWSFESMRGSYERKFGRTFPDDVHPLDYEMCRCAKCKLLFAVPQVAGDFAFYSWATSLPNYYRPSRWEWGVLRDLLASAARPVKLLEVGCGTGNFLKLIGAEKNVIATGIDKHAPSVEAARASGLDVECMDLEGYVEAFPGRQFDVVCAFHCLEHVESPKAVLIAAAKALAPGGHVIFSVPYSPTSDDVIEIDPMNLPPHHMTQWNQTSLRCLGAMTGMAVDIRTDEGIYQSSLLRTCYWYSLANLPGEKQSSTLVALMGLLLNPRTVFKSVRFALTRERLAGKPAGDTALASFSKA